MTSFRTIRVRRDRGLLNLLTPSCFVAPWLAGWKRGLAGWFESLIGGLDRLASVSMASRHDRPRGRSAVLITIPLNVPAAKPFRPGSFVRI